MTKVAYNACFGGFDLSDEAFEMLLSLKGIDFDKSERSSSIMNAGYQKKGIAGDEGHLYCYKFTEDRRDPDLIKVIETLGKKANGMCANLAIEDVPEGMSYRIDEYDGSERVMTLDDYDWQKA